VGSVATRVREREEGTTSMVSRTAAQCAPSSDAIEFVRFCYRRRRVGWPELYDEMCAVAGRGLFRGWGPDELNAEGIGFGLFELPALAALVGRVLADEHDRRERLASENLCRVHAEPIEAVDVDRPESIDEHTEHPVRHVRWAAVTA
jgi:hypothetical protein